MSERWTERPELAALYDTECAGREDHDFYLQVAADLGAGSVVDIGCGTGVFALALAARGHTVTGVDPAAAMLDIARRRSAGTPIRWICGHVGDVHDASADLAVMMGHVAQYFVDDDEWAATLRHVRRVLRPSGRLAFETRNPSVDWASEWVRDRTLATFPHPAGGEFTSWVEVVDVTGTAASYTTTHEGHTRLSDGLHLVARETLRFRSDAEILATLDAAGFEVEATWGGWDRSPHRPTSRELIVLARCP